MSDVHKDVVKVSVNLSSDDFLFIKSVADYTGMSMSDVIRHAISMERVAHRIRERGGKLVIEENDERFEIII